MIRNLSDMNIKSIETNIDGIKIKKNKVLVGGGLFSIPSDMFPLNSKKIDVFYCDNTCELTADVQDVDTLLTCFNNTEARLGRCYTNIRELRQLALQLGLKGKLRCYVGWLKVGSSDRLIHHCWAVYNNVHVLDLGANKLDFKLEWDVKDRNLTIDELRKLLADNYFKNKDKPNHEVYTIGRTIPNHFYIGCECEPYDGITIYNNMMDRYPNHPSYTHNNSDGSSKLQRMILDRCKN